MFHWPEDINPDIVDELQTQFNKIVKMMTKKMKISIYVEILNFIIITYNINFKIDII